MVDKDPRLITVRRNTVVWVGIVTLILLALGVGITIWSTVGSKSPPSTTNSTASGTSTPTAHVSTTTSPPTTTTTGATVPAVLSCGPGSTPHVHPTELTVGCARGNITVTDITWNEWGAGGGGQGMGTLNVDLSSAPAIVVVFNDVDGIFQDVSITPSKDVSTTPISRPTTGPTTGRTTTTTTALTTTPTTGGLSPVVASQPGSGWGGD